MSRGGDIDGLVAVAIRDEQTGVSVYSKLSERSESKAVKELFSWLSRQEETHKERFVELSKKLEASNPPEHHSDDYTGYLEWLVTEGGNPSIRSEFESCKNDTERISLAIRFEREQLSLQQDLGSFIGSEHRSIVEAIIDEERGHIVRLSAEREKLG